jgi:hypothetical protein
MISAFADNSAMADDMWRKRLEEAVAESGKSKRSISLASGNGPGYVHSILTEGKDPTIEKIMNVCDAIPVSPIYILHGLNVGRIESEILRGVRDNPDAANGVLAILRSKAAS